ncbi:MAG: MarC family protein [Methanoregula sp.]|nr:MarC family protein [Methanoregula sp.]
MRWCFCLLPENPVFAISIMLTYYMMQNSDYILTRIGQRDYRAINRLMGMLLIAIAVESEWYPALHFLCFKGG